jgi:cytoskeletal protein CcmA (bactofilin family)
MLTRPKAALCLLLALCLVLFTTEPGQAVSFETDENIHISNLHRIDDDLIAWGSSVTVDGLVEGDLIAGCYTLNTNGHIRGSANVFAFKFHHTKRIDGALRGSVNLTEIDGYVGRSVLLAGNDIRIGEKSVVEKDVILRAATVHLDGLVKGSADIEAQTIFLSGTVHGDALLKANKIKILVPATIKGDLTYVTKDEDALELAPGVVVLGETVFKQRDSIEPTGSDSFLTSTIVQTSKTLAAFLFGIILLSLFNKYAIEAANQLRARFAVATAAGLVSMIIVIISLLILFLSMMLVAIGLILAGSESALTGAIVLSLSILMVPITSFVTVSGAVLFYSGKIIIGVLIGYLLIRLAKPNAAYLSRFQLLVGLIILTIAFSLPYVGFVLYLLLSTIGAGAIVLGVKYCRRELNQSVPSGEPELGKDS